MTPRRARTILGIAVLVVLAGISIYLAVTAGTETTALERFAAEQADRSLDVQAFRALLRDRDAARDVERIRIEPRGNGKAVYRVTYRSRGRRHLVDAEFPGDLTRQMFDAGIPYSVKPPSSSAFEDGPVKQKQIDATSFQVMLMNRDEASRIERIAIDVLGSDHARYRIQLEGNPVTHVVYAEFPGQIIQRIEAAHIVYSVNREAR